MSLHREPNLRYIIKILFLVAVVFWFFTSYVGLPTISDGVSSRQKKASKTNCGDAIERLKKCEAREEIDFVRQADAKPIVPKFPSKQPQRRIVHLDLKGAPPRMEYLLKLLPVFRDLGATGLLVEYEDMFPYHGYVRVVSSPNAYSYDEIHSLLDTAKRLHLEIIPLVQTLGHFECVLKHVEFQHLRETKQYPNMVCPLLEDSQELVKRMITQVLDLHPHIRTLHLGGDEVFNLKDCDQCKASKKSKTELYLHHMLPLFEHLKVSRGGRVRPLIWDDMIRRWTADEMMKIAPYADIMVWAYVPDVETYTQFPDTMWTNYEKAFESVWIASSFKGALAADNNLVPIPLHVQNHVSWMNLINKINLRIEGVALTGWSRYDHLATLCELLPAALPALGLSLQVLKEGSSKKIGQDIVESILGFSNKIVINKDPFGSWDTSVPNFPGGDVYALIAELENHVSWYMNTKNRMDSWCTERHLEEQKISRLQLSGAEGSLKQMLPSFRNFRAKCVTVLKDYFFDDAVKEWVRDKVDGYITLCEQLDARLNKIKERV